VFGWLYNSKKFIPHSSETRGFALKNSNTLSNNNREWLEEVFGPLKDKVSLNILKDLNKYGVCLIDEPEVTMNNSYLGPLENYLKDVSSSLRTEPNPRRKAPLYLVKGKFINFILLPCTYF
jgi:hypothetical protein